MAKLKYLPYKSNFLKAFSDVRVLFIVVAMESEERALLKGQKFSEVTLGKKYKSRIKELDLGKRKVIVGQSGVGLVNAALLFNAVLEHYPIDAILLLGVGGALDEQLEVGDTVIAKCIIQHDSIASRNDGNLFMAPGELTLSAPPDQQVDPVMRCDEILSKWLEESLSSSTGKLFWGTILSGSEFAANIGRKKQLRELAQDALLVDMEAAALAQLARKANLPFAAAKTVADRATTKSSVSDDYKKFLEAATEHCRCVINHLESKE